MVELFERAVASGEALCAVDSLKGAAFENLFVSRHEGKTRATMKIQEGCDRFCTYCVIPYVRGPVRSMPLPAVRAEAARLAGAGYREIVVTGIHLASYGRGEGATLLEAIHAVAEPEGVKRIPAGFAGTVDCNPGICGRHCGGKQGLPAFSPFHAERQRGRA